MRHALLLLAFAGTLIVSSTNAYAKPSNKECIAVGSFAGGAGLFFGFVGSLFENGKYDGKALLLAGGGGAVLGGAGLGMCFAQQAEPRFMSTLTTALALGTGTFLLTGALAGSYDDYDAFRPTTTGWIVSGGALVAGGTLAYVLASTPSRRSWLTHPALLGAMAGGVLTSGIWLRTIGQCSIHEDSNCDGARNTYRNRRDTLVAFGMATLLGTAVGFTGALLADTSVGSTQEGTPLLMMSGSF